MLHSLHLNHVELEFDDYKKSEPPDSLVVDLLLHRQRQVFHSCDLRGFCLIFVTLQGYNPVNVLL